MRQARMITTACRNSLAVERDKLSRKPTRRDNADLLTENSPHRQFETIPSSGRAQPRTPRHQRRKQRVERLVAERP